jgi:hypothetical protein
MARVNQPPRLHKLVVLSIGWMGCVFHLHFYITLTNILLQLMFFLLLTFDHSFLLLIFSQP